MPSSTSVIVEDETYARSKKEEEFSFAKQTEACKAKLILEASKGSCCLAVNTPISYKD